MTDSWSRMISFHFLNQTTQENFFTTDSAHGAGLLWSNIPSILAYQQHQAPFPILVANSGPVDSNMVGAPSLNSTVYEACIASVLVEIDELSLEHFLDYPNGTCIL